MTKQDFSQNLKSILSARGLSEAEISKSVDYYLEIIDDRIEDGMTEEEAVSAIGSVEEIAKNILFDAPLGVIVKSKIKNEKKKSSDNTVLMVILLVFGFPIWFPLLLAAFIVLITIYAVIFSLIVAVFAVIISLFVSGIALIPAGFLIISQTMAGTLVLIGAGFLLIGISLLLIFPAKYTVLGLIKLTGAILRGIKSLFIGKKVSS